MTKSALIKNLVLNQIDEVVGLNRILVIGVETKSSEIVSWAESELNGYKYGDIIPTYRKYKLGTFIYSGMKDNIVITNASLQPEIIDDRILEIIKGKCFIADGASSIKRQIENSAGLIYRDLPELIGYVYLKIGVQCTSIKMQMPDTILSKSLSGMRTSLIKALVKLEAVYGSLDNFDIDYNKSLKQTEEVTREVTGILYCNDNVFEHGEANG